MQVVAGLLTNDNFVSRSLRVPLTGLQSVAKLKGLHVHAHRSLPFQHPVDGIGIDGPDLLRQA